MARVVVFAITRPRAVLRGHLQQLLLEVAPGTFVGKLPSKHIKSLWTAICAHSQSAIAVITDNNEAGFRCATHGERRYEVVDNHGIPLIRRKKVRKSGKTGKDPSVAGLDAAGD